MLFTSTSVAVLGFASYASAHMKLSKPVPYANALLSNGPLAADGSDFPCKLLFDTTTPAASMALGSTQPLEFIGGATHGGGSCQVSITYDNPPTKNSVFKVIHSIEGGCPTRSSGGNIGGDAAAPDPDKYSFQIPADLPTGKATLAWTWFNKVGNREMYMNCAPIDISGGSSKRSEEEELIVREIDQVLEKRDQAAFNKLPDMFVANIGMDCHTSETFDLTFPNAGSSVAKEGTNSNFKGPNGSACQAAGAPAAVAPPSQSSAPPAAPGVFVTVPASSAVAPTAAPTVAASPTAPAAASSQAPAAVSSPTPIASAAPSVPATSPGSTAPGSACSPEGLWNCIAGTSFQQCGSGTWSVVQQLAAGTTCTPGQSSAINITAKPAKRAVRFSSEHIRRHIHRSS